ncbi:HAD-IA family hydrolase [Clostridium tertium]|uniref:HAD family hydrolase n=1 Tax=Clostridium tertium TaxID=1559 RepID=UPI0023303A63|nr:HAD-IA family hydrolase [Clostridium tertium]MDB1921730.1 HAD-IA family hydrolase [Clostridium tertium]MDB1924933.1 HAD-IA family hydrolase [Clostridium tertium]MDB1929572.1 HAD-IA family hydrolase [Clostridium tertium]
MIKGVVFDLDDTLILEYDYIVSGFKVVANRLSKDLKKEESEVFDKLIELFEESSKLVYNRLLDEYNFKYENEYIEELIYIYRNHYPSIELCDEAIYTINMLKKEGIKLGVISDGYKEAQRKKIEKINNKYFDSIIITDELGKEFWKPHEKPYILSADELDIKFEEMIYVGDNISKDFIKANELGITTVGIKHEKGIYKELKFSNEYLPKYWVQSLKEIISLIDDINNRRYL